MRLATWIPSFEHAARELAYFTGAAVPESTLRRLAEDAGAAYVQVQAEQARTIARELPEPLLGPAVQQVSVDGAMVPLVGGDWAEVKTLAVGALTGQAPGQQVRAEDVSYFSRLAEAQRFGAEALVETHRRGVETAEVVVAVVDGAAWAQGFVDAHRVDAVRILDFCHAAGYLSLAAQAAFGPGTAACLTWVGRQRHELRHGDPDQVLAALRALHRGAGAQARAVIGTSLAYLGQRREQIRYAECALLGLPIGSGVVESANKLLVEERLKGAGMHWARHHVNPMLALRTIACNDRWEEAWPQIVTQLRAQRAQRTRARRAARRTKLTAVAQPPAPLVVTAPAAVEPAAPAATAPPPAQRSGPTKPAPDHPWRRFRFGRNCRPQPDPRAVTDAA